MPQSAVKLDMMDEKQFDGLQNLVVRKASELFRNRTLSHQVANTLILSLLKETFPTSNIVNWVDRKLPQTVESYFNELRLYCFKYALDLTQMNEIAEDIAQQSIIELLTAEQDILNIKAWLRGLVSNKTKQYVRQQSKEHGIVRDIKANNVHNAGTELPPTEHLYEKLNADQVKALLSTKDFRLYKKLKKFKNLVEYATAYNLSHTTARKHSHEIRTNLKAAYLKATGWNGTQAILTFRRLNGIKRFLQSMTELYGSNQSISTDKYNLALDKDKLISAFEGVNKVTDWGISMLTDDRFRVFLCYKGSKDPVMIVMYININRANQITITDCHRASMLAALPDPHGRVDLFRHGKPAMTYKEILHLLT